MPGRERTVGEFCWINILCPDPAGAQRFFGELFGWSYVEIPGMGHRIQLDGHDVGGLFDLATSPAPAGTPAGIGVMVRVESADDASARAGALGGKGQPAFDVGPPGRMAECYDPVGANFDLWQPKTSPGMTVDGTAHGAPSWFELMTTDTDASAKYYSALFGWTPKKPSYPGLDYTTFWLTDDVPVGGMLPITPMMGPMPPHWGVYFTVRDVHATVAKALELGGSVSYPVMELEAVGKFGGLVSPQGVHFSVITYPM
jgi:predicted enzyme related to lactoylglutathione lyase